jgi:hypothetical protein
MPLYYLIEDAEQFHCEVRPALTASWRMRSFAPCVPLCHRLGGLARDFAIRFHLGDQESLVALVAGGLPFDRAFWAQLVGEILWFAAVDIPEIESNLDALRLLIDPAASASCELARTDWPPIVQAHLGSRDLIFGGGFYRPQSAGWNDVQDVQRLNGFLTAVRPEEWKASNLANLPDLPPQEREEELAFVRDWFPSFQELYRGMALNRQVVICEEVVH